MLRSSPRYNPDFDIAFESSRNESNLHLEMVRLSNLKRKIQIIEPASMAVATATICMQRRYARDICPKYMTPGIKRQFAATKLR